jgi:hypothetical protein
MCLGCRARRPVAELTRLCLCDGELRIDVPGKKKKKEKKKEKYKLINMFDEGL